MTAASRTRLAPEARRRQILDVARRLFASRPYAEVTTALIARDAGVTRALVHHYFGGVRDLYLEVMSEMTDALVEVPGEIPDTSREERVARNVAAWLDIVEANRETWLAVAVHGDAIPDPEIRDLIAAAREAGITRSIEANHDVISDTPATRLALRGLLGLHRTACADWLAGRATREQVATLLTRTFLDLVERTSPALEDVSES